MKLRNNSLELKLSDSLYLVFSFRSYFQSALFQVTLIEAEPYCVTGRILWSF